MISRVRGELITRNLGVVEVMTAAGVAYEVAVPLTVYQRLPREGSEIELRTAYVVREDGVTLYGFLHDSERVVFGRLLTASGVGPRLALNMLSTMAPDRLVRAILGKDIATLRQIPGLGTKKAERLVVELADRLDDLAVATSGPGDGLGATEEAVGALVALGFAPLEAAAAVRRVLDEDGSIQGTQQLIRAALASISPG